MKGAPPFAAIELMFTMAPREPLAIQCLDTACDNRKGARVLMSNCLLNMSTVVFIKLPRSVVPAAFTSPSTRPSRTLMASAAAASTDDGSDMSASTKKATQPAPESSATAASPFDLVRLNSAKALAPQALSCLAISRPKPCVPPVTMNRDPPRSNEGLESGGPALQKLATVWVATSLGTSLTTATLCLTKEMPSRMGSTTCSSAGLSAIHWLNSRMASPKFRRWGCASKWLWT
mmetsp:Transcript_29109/g.75660  ORF Transcript_29109/g.75660 Transcript_29109/m.75660 type:complete len:233 (-) Transcript_29109:1789-2487(-)